MDLVLSLSLVCFVIDDGDACDANDWSIWKAHFRCRRSSGFGGGDAFENNIFVLIIKFGITTLNSNKIDLNFINE